MNKTKRFSIAAALLAAAVLLASCADVLSTVTGKTADETLAPGTGLVRVIINGEDPSASVRTIFPTLPAPTGLEYRYIFNATYGNGSTAYLSGTSQTDTFVLEIGEYTLAVEAWDGGAFTGTLAWVGDGTVGGNTTFTIAEGGSNPTITVNLIPYGSGALTGSFTYAIPYPTGATLDYFTWTPLDGSGAPVSLLTANPAENITVDPPDSTWNLGSTVNSGFKVQIAPGSYLVRAHLTDPATGKTAGKEAVVRVYAGLTTFLDLRGFFSGSTPTGAFDFTADDFTDYNPDFDAGTYITLTVGTLGGEDYPTLNGAFGAISNTSANYVITLTSNIINTAQASLNGSNVEVSLMGNGHTITAAGVQGIQVTRGRLTLRDLTLFGPSSTSGVVLDTNATVTMEEGVIITGFSGKGVHVYYGTFTQNGGSIYDNGSGNNYDTGVYVNSLGIFNLNGGVITKNDGYNGGGVYVDGGDFTQSGGTIYDNGASYLGGGVYVKSGTFTQSGGTIRHNEAQYGGGVYVEGTFTQTAGIISGNSTIGSGGGVFVDSTGTFTQSVGGTISGNSAQDGGGVYVNGGTLTQLNGTISDNTAQYGGGGVYLTGGSSTQLNGTISGNSAQDGGGVYVTYGNFFQNAGSSITGNHVTLCGGGVYVDGGQFYQNGGSISGNDSANDAGGGVFMYGGYFQMSDGSITGNVASYGGGGVFVMGPSANFIRYTPGAITGNTATGGRQNIEVWDQTNGTLCYRDNDVPSTEGNLTVELDSSGGAVDNYDGTWSW
jgi:hypothetical protein